MPIDSIQTQTAIDLINQMIGYWTAKIEIEWTKARPDQQTVGYYKEMIQHLIMERMQCQELQPSPVIIQKAIDVYGPRLEEVRKLPEA
jgi:hypothetical protein